MFFKIPKQNKVYFAFLAIICSGFLFFGNTKNVQAKGLCSWNPVGGGQDADYFADEAACKAYVANINGAIFKSFETAEEQDAAGTAAQQQGTGGETLSSASVQQAAAANKSQDGNCPISATSPLIDTFKCVLLGVLELVGYLLSMANTIFEWCVNPIYWDVIFKNPAIYSSWEIVRDLLNIMFIVTLLYSAFVIIFQVDSSGAKSRLLTIVLMALLVNFSFPITRFIIDMSNSLMYTIITTMDFGNSSGGGASGALGKITEASAIHNIIYPGPKADVASILTSIIFIFVLAVTLMATGLLLLIRMITLAVLLIFSPVAFVTKILPETKNYSASWWKELFNNAIFGPAMLLGLYVATQMMLKMKGSLGFFDQASKQADSSMAAVVATMAWFTIPIIILWYVMGTAKKFSIAGAGAVMGQAEKFTKAVGMRVSGAQFATDTYKAYRSRRDQAKEDSWSKKFGTNLGSQQDRLRGNIIGGRDAQIRYEKDVAAKVKKAADRNDMANLGVDNLQGFVNGGSAHERAAAIQELLNRNTFDMTNPANAVAYQRMRTELGTTSQTFNAINNKLKESDPVSAFAHITSDIERRARMTEHVNSNKFDAKKLGVNSLRGDAGADFLRTAFQNEAISTSDLEDLRKKSNGHQNAITRNIGVIAGDATNIDLAGIERNFNAARAADPNSDATRDLDTQLRVARNVQMAHVAQVGSFHAGLTGGGSLAEIAANTASRAQVISRLNKDTAKRINVATAQAYANDFAGNMNSSRYKAMITEMEDTSSAREINNHVRDATNNRFRPTDPRNATFANTNRRYALDPDLMNI